jgi:hypothetical protein
MAYLDALGVDSYVSRTQLPGAAVTRRLAIVSAPRIQTDSSESLMKDLQPTPPGRDVIPPNLRASFGESPKAMADEVPVSAQPLPRSESVPRFSLTAIVAGDWLWLEELAGPLMTEQVKLIQSMAQALALYQQSGSGPAKSVRPDVTQFDWPIHTNHQLDLGAAAALASVAGFVERRLEQHGCRGLVLLGQACAKRVPQQEISLMTVSTVSSAELLAQPALKPQVWRDLLPLATVSSALHS